MIKIKTKTMKKDGVKIGYGSTVTLKGSELKLKHELESILESFIINMPEIVSAIDIVELARKVAYKQQVLEELTNENKN